MPTKEPLADHFYTQVFDSIKLVFDLTSRIDERVKMLVERTNDVEERIDKFIETHQALVHRVTILESDDQEKELAELKQQVTELKNKVHLLELKCETLQLKDQGNERRWMIAFEFVFRLAFIVLGGWLLFKLGWQAPTTP